MIRKSYQPSATQDRSDRA